MAIVGLEPKVLDFERLTQREAATALGISNKTLRTYEATGLMPIGRRIGRCTYYFGRDVKRCWRNYFKEM